MGDWGDGQGLRGLNRIRLVMLGFAACFALIGLRLVYLGVLGPAGEQVQRSEIEERLPRPDIVDRNGVVMATDIPLSSLYADPRKILDVDEAVELITGAIPELKPRELRDKLTQKRSFVWLKRQITPRQKEEVHNLGIPGIGFRNETRRVYPKGRLAAHVLGYVDVDSRGLAGIEKFLDERGALYTASLADPVNRAAMPATLSIDSRVQFAVTDELAKALTEFKATAAAGLVLDARTGEVLAAASLPDFNPNDPKDAQEKTRLNRFTGGVFELGSSVKTVTFAMALDAGVTTLERSYDCRAPLVAGRARIDDYHATRRILTVPEIFTHSSNIGTAKMALDVGIEGHQAFLRRIGFFDRLRTELPEAAEPLFPKHWGRVHTMTAAFGHGISIQPLQLAAATAATVNGGILVEPTFLKREAEAARSVSRRVVSAATSAEMRHLMKLNVDEGTGTKAAVLGYRVGGKTGSAEKVVGGRYSSDHRLTTFLAAFPIDDPRYVVLVLLDEPQPSPETFGYATAGWNAAPATARIVQRIAPLLGVAPIFSPDEAAKIAKQANAAVIGD